MTIGEKFSSILSGTETIDLKDVKGILKKPEPGSISLLLEQACQRY